MAKQERGFLFQKTRAAFLFDAAHYHSSLLTPHSSLANKKSDEPQKLITLFYFIVSDAGLKRHTRPDYRTPITDYFYYFFPG